MFYFSSKLFATTNFSSNFMSKIGFRCILESIRETLVEICAQTNRVYPNMSGQTLSIKVWRKMSSDTVFSSNFFSPHFTTKIPSSYQFNPLSLVLDFFFLKFFPKSQCCRNNFWHRYLSYVTQISIVCSCASKRVNL